MPDKIGGFFVSLQMLTDEGSFRKGTRGISEVRGALDFLSKIAFGVALAAVPALLVKLTQMDAAMLASSKVANLGYDDLAMWSQAITTAGGNADGFTSALAALDAQFVRMKLGEAIPEGTAKDLGMLGLNLAKVMNEGSSERARDILRAANAMQDQRKAAQMVKDLLGDAGEKFFWNMKLSHTSLESNLEAARKTVMTNEESARKALGFQTQLNRLGGAGKGAATLFADTLMGRLTPGLDELNKWIETHHDQIVSGITDIANKVADAIEKLVGLIPQLEKFAPVLVGLAAAFALFKGAQMVAGFASSLAALATGVAAAAPVIALLTVFAAAMAGAIAMEKLGEGKYEPGSTGDLAQQFFRIGPHTPGKITGPGVDPSFKKLPGFISSPVLEGNPALKAAMEKGFTGGQGAPGAGSTLTVTVKPAPGLKVSSTDQGVDKTGDSLRYIQQLMGTQ